MRKRLLFIICIALASLWTSAAFADVIGSYTLQTIPVTSGQELDWMCKLSIRQSVGDMVYPSLLNGADANDPSGRKGIDISDNIGRTFWFSSDQDDPDYSRFVRKLTDDKAQYVMVDILFGTTIIGFPVTLGNLPGLLGYYDYPYFQGYTIDRIGFTIDSESHTIDYSAPSPHIYQWHFTVDIEGNPPVPEPASLTTLVMGIGGLGVGFCRRFGGLKSKTDKLAC